MKNMISRFSALPRVKTARTLLRPSSVALAALLAFGSAPVIAASPLDDGVMAYRHGDFEKSARTFAPLAENGNATAQYLLSCQTINGSVSRPIRTPVGP